MLELQTQGLSIHPAVNGQGEWIEASVLVCGLPLSRACRIAARFGQRALLYWHRGHPVELISTMDATRHAP